MEVSQVVELVNDTLLNGEPGNISVDEHSGYTGYKPQAVVDAMNDCFGIGNWGFEEVSSEIVPGEKSGLAVSQVKAWIKDVEFHAPAWGQSRVTRGDVGDAKKGAQTDALKKALSYFSIGNRAYHGQLEKDKKPTKPVLKVVEKPAPSTSDVPVPSELRKLFASIGQTLETAEKLTFKQAYNDLELTPEQCFTLHQTYDAWKKRYDEKQAASGK